MQADRSADGPEGLRLSRTWTLAIWLGLLVLCLLGLDRSLWTPDEPREAEIGREMLLAPGVVPTLNGARFIEKPPLYYWTVAAAYRVAGTPSAAAARSVSAIAGLLTLFAVAGWGRRAASGAVALMAATILATCLQFLQSSHWVLIDPLLALFVTVAAWAAWEALQPGGHRGAIVAFYAALILALWTKGLIGPALIGAGVVVHALVERRLPWRELKMIPGAIIMAAGLATLGVAIYASGGYQALYEWAWVNHVQRFANPALTGHRQPLAYYVWMLPLALLPWSVSVVPAFFPAAMRGAGRPARLRRYCASLALGMTVLLSASATKRGIYVLPLLPLLALLGASLLVQAFRREGNAPGPLWWLQLASCAAFAVGVPVGAMAYAHRYDQLAAIVIAVPALTLLAAALASRRGASAAVGLLALGAIFSAGGAVALAPRLFDAQKDLTPLVAWLDGKLPPGEPVYVIDPDETLMAIIPFASGRRVVATDKAELIDPHRDRADLPAHVLVQEKSGFVSLAPAYRPSALRWSGGGRAVTLWERESAPQ